MNADPEENPDRERKLVVVRVIVSAVGAMALVYGILVGHASVGLVLASGLVGFASIGLELWIKHTKYKRLPYWIGSVLPIAGLTIVQHHFLGPHDAPWSILAAQLGALFLGFCASFAVYSLIRRAVPDKLERNARPL